MSNSEVTPACKDVKEENNEDATCETNEMPRHLKRQLSKEENVPFIKKRRRKRGVATPQNALMQLCDIKRWVQFKSMSLTESTFTMSVDVNGQTFIGKGPSKKKARLNAAEQAVKSLLRVPNTVDTNQPKDAKITKSGDADCEMHGCSKPQISDAANVPLNIVKQTTNESTVPENALNQLYQMKCHVRFQFVSQTEPIFTISVEVNGQTFVGKGPSKKKAKLDAAEQAFRSFVQLPNAEEAHQLMGRQIPNVALTSNFAEPEADVLSNNLQTSHDEKKIDVTGNFSISPNESNLISRRMSKVLEQPDCTDPVMSLNELCTDLKKEILSEIRESPISLRLSGSIGGSDGVQNELHEDPSEVPKVLVDLVSRLVDEKIASLTGGFKSQNAVLSGIMTRGNDVDSTSHICVSSDAKVDRPKGAEVKKDEIQGQLGKKEYKTRGPTVAKNACMK